MTTASSDIQRVYQTGLLSPMLYSYMFPHRPLRFQSEWFMKPLLPTSIQCFPSPVSSTAIQKTGPSRVSPLCKSPHIFNHHLSLFGSSSSPPDFHRGLLHDHHTAVSVHLEYPLRPHIELRFQLALLVCIKSVYF